MQARFLGQVLGQVALLFKKPRCIIVWRQQRHLYWDCASHLWQWEPTIWLRCCQPEALSPEALRRSTGCQALLAAAHLSPRHFLSSLAFKHRCRFISATESAADFATVLRLKSARQHFCCEETMSYYGTIHQHMPTTQTKLILKRRIEAHIKDGIASSSVQV